jgi:pullulanase-type alpha-1,6-glucosidase
MGQSRARWFTGARIVAVATALAALAVSPQASATPAAGEIDLTKSRAIWVSKDRLVWDVPAGSGHELRYDPDGAIAVHDGRIDGGAVLPLQPDPAGLPADVAQRFPHLRGLPVFQLRPSDVDLADDALRGQVVAAQFDAGSSLVNATSVQIAGALDDLYAAEAKKLSYGPSFNGPHPTLRVWAPTARSVVLRRFDRTPPAEDAVPREVRPLVRDDASGSWSTTGHPSWMDSYYQYEVTAWQPATQRVQTSVVTDPYSVALSVDSTHSQIVDLRDPRTAPRGWQRTVAKGLGADPTEHAVTELHVRDFSITDGSVPEADRGTYRAFTHANSVGMRHLRRLADAGMDAVHLLPTFDIATIPERRENQRTPDCDLPSLPPDSAAQQECVGAVAGSDAFNWGYDPWHYDVPEGSYATSDAQSGWARVAQYREMMKSLHDNGNRVIVDVVYNHTAAAGASAPSVLDRVVPGYYHRLLADGSVANSTCCANTATENAMMDKLVVDSVVHWARTYKVDGFRFDLMGHHPKANILAVRQALDRLTLQRDGVVGSHIRIYGEGWDFGEVGGNSRFVQATQANMAGTGVGTFNDRLRDAVRGGGPFDGDPRVQGLASGLAGAPNGAPVNGTPDEQSARLVNYQDLVMVGMAGNGADYRFRSATGREVAGREVSYNGSAAGYTGAPREAITYVDAHDNETLFDALTYKLPVTTSMEDRVRSQVLALAPVLLGQGQPFVHAGSEFMRSKSLDRNSYDSGDWFNTYDPGLVDNGFGHGLPPAADNRDKWSFASPLLADPALAPATEHLRATVDRALELLRIRKSSPLFTLDDAALVQAKLSFPAPGGAAGDGVVLAYLDDTVGPDLDPGRRGVLVLINPRPDARDVALPVGDGWSLHEVQQTSTDPVVRGIQVDGSTVRMPARTVAVLVR